MRRNHILILLFIIGHTLGVSAQELNMQVKVIIPVNVNIKADPSIYRNLENDIKDFFNKTKWTDHEYTEVEKIEGSIQITINEELSNTSFLAEVSVQTSRPVFNTDYKTSLLNFQDKSVNFTYLPGQPIQSGYRAYFDNLSSILSYYAYLILGFDYDSFSLYGGEDYFQYARDIFDNLPNGLKRDDAGWSNAGVNGRSKYFLIENILSPKLRPFRQVIYEYHRLALDNMWQDAEKSRAVMLSSLGIIEDLHQAYPNSYFLQTFGDAKHNELVEIFKAADAGQKAKLRSLMTLTSLSLANRYDALK
ncbi:MAG: DUF4835 family protein [Saprospiraceae bacterium]|nr:DUF4835 family protein [Saprospiraceae bacterium]